MADIDIERKSGGSIWPWLLGLLALLLIGWLLFSLLGDDDEAAVVDPVATAPVPAEVQPTTVGAPPEPVAAAAGIPVSQIIESPATWSGRTVNGEVRVTEVVSDRGFWITDQGERLFVIINEPVGPTANEAQRTESINIEPNQSLRISEAMIYDNVANVPGELEPETRQIAQGLPVFLGVRSGNINILGAQDAAAGTGM